MEARFVNGQTLHAFESSNEKRKKKKSAGMLLHGVDERTRDAGAFSRLQEERLININISKTSIRHVPLRIVVPSFPLSYHRHI